MFQLPQDFRNQCGQIETITVTTGKLPFDINGTKFGGMIKRLQHRELIQIGIQHAIYQPVIQWF